jgi:sulfite exporter TauE/SafE/copper chaperone CopZ
MSSRIVKKTILIEGMTCVSCENRIERKLSATPGIESAQVSYTNGIAVVNFDPEVITLQQLEEIIEQLDYRIKRLKPEPEKSKFSITSILGVGVIFYALYIIASRLGLLNIFYNFPIAKAGMGYGMLFLIGMLTSVHCVAMCGGICLSQCVPKSNESGNSKLAALRPSVLYNFGRVISYTVIGGIVGALGSAISLSGSFQGIMQIIAGIFMVIMGLNMLNIFPWLRRFNLRMPKVFAKKIYAQKRSNSPLYVGLLNGLMPCGPLQAMQLYALSTGSPLKGALSMFLFSIGTVPLMLTFGAISSFLSKKFTHRMMTAGAVLVLVLGVFMFNNGISLSGLRVPEVVGKAETVNGTKNSGGSIAEIKDGVQTVTTSLASGKYQPIVVQKGIPVKWTIKADAKNINGCNNSMVIRKYGISHDFTPGDNVIEFTPTESGTVPYSCWMGMIRSKITVVDDLSQVSGGGNLDSGLSGVDQIVNYKIPTDKVAVASVKDGVQTVEINVEDTRFSPAVIVVQRDLETTWTINADKLNSSNETLSFPTYSTQLPLKEGENPIQFIPDTDFEFSSIDNSYYGYVKVVDDINNIDLEAIKKEVSEFVPTVQDDGSFSGGGGGCCAQ